MRWIRGQIASGPSLPVVNKVLLETASLARSLTHSHIVDGGLWATVAELMPLATDRESVLADPCSLSVPFKLEQIGHGGG